MSNDSLETISLINSAIDADGTLLESLKQQSFYIANNVSQPPLFSPVILRFILQSAARQLIPRERVADCLRTLAPDKHEVEVHVSQDAKRARFGNLVVCGRVWQCPVCAHRISEQRRATLSAQMARLPYPPIMVTYTIRHQKSQSLKQVLDVLLNAKRQFRQGVTWQRIESDYGLVAALRALEVTHGEAGWHAHIHELVLLRSNLGKQLISLTNELKTRWKAIVKRVGGDASYRRGLEITANVDDISEYVAKIGKDEFEMKSQWQIEHEVTKSVVKLGRAGGRTPNQLLYDYAFHADLRAGMLWKEYVEAFKGKKQLHPASFAALLGEQEEPEDGVLAEAKFEGEQLLALLTWEQWRVILKHEKRGHLQEVALQGFEALCNFLRPMGIELQEVSHG